MAEITTVKGSSAAGDERGNAERRKSFILGEGKQKIIRGHI